MLNTCLLGSMITMVESIAHSNDLRWRVLNFRSSLPQIKKKTKKTAFIILRTKISGRNLHKNKVVFEHLEYKSIGKGGVPSTSSASFFLNLPLKTDSYSSPQRTTNRPSSTPRQRASLWFLMFLVLLRKQNISFVGIRLSVCWPSYLFSEDWCR